jgi:hypothetical protein
MEAVENKTINNNLLLIFYWSTDVEAAPPREHMEAAGKQDHQ